MNGLLIIVLIVLIGHYLLDAIVDLLNVRHLSPTLPPEFADVYDADRYQRSQTYTRDTTHFGLIEQSVLTLLLIVFILAGGFAAVDHIVRHCAGGLILRGLLFIGALTLIHDLAQWPFDTYRTFVIEERYGFNRTTGRTFILDRLKAWLLIALIGAPLMAAILWLFDRAGAFAWLCVWGVAGTTETVLIFLAPVLIMPLFNKFVPLADGELKTSIERYAADQRFAMRGIFTMDGSRRSAKSNAFFTGFGRFRRIVLFDTLVAKHTVAQIVAVLAHEIGHYRKKHVLKFLLLSLLNMGLMFALLSLTVHSRRLSAAVGVQEYAPYVNLTIFMILYVPLATVLSVATHALSRRYEYEADAFAVRTQGEPAAMVEALKTLSRDNLVNLTPHPVMVALRYSHPPMLERIRAIRGTLT